MAEFDLSPLGAGGERLLPALAGAHENARKLQVIVRPVTINVPAPTLGWQAAPDADFPAQEPEAPRPSVQRDAWGDFHSPVGALLTKTLGAYAEQESGAAGLKASMLTSSGQPDAAFDAVNKMALMLGRTLPGSAADFQSMMQTLVEEGVSAQDILHGMGEQAATFAVAMQQTPEAAATFVASLQAATGTTAQEMQGVLDTVQRAQRAGLAESDTLDFFRQLQPATGQQNAAEVQRLAPAAVMLGRSGFSGADAGQATRTLLQRTQEPGRVRAANQALQGTGITFDFSADAGDLPATLRQLEQLQTLSQRQRDGVLGQLFGHDDATLRAVDVLINRTTAGYAQVQQQMLQQADLSQRAGVYIGTLSQQWEVLNDTVNNGMAAAGAAFAGEAMSGIQTLSALAQGMGELIAQHPLWVRSAAGIAAAFGAVSLAVTGVTYALRIMSMVAALSPMGLFIRLMVAGAGAIIANWESVAKWFNDIWQPISDRLASWWASLRGFFAEDEVQTSLFSSQPSAAFDTSSMMGGDPRNTQGELRVTFDNAPQGMRVMADQKMPDNIGYDVGYSSLAQRY